MRLSPLNSLSPLGGNIDSSAVFNLSSALHEWNYQNSTDVGTTVTAVDSGSIGGLDMVNHSAGEEPTISGGYLRFNGTTQGIKKDTANFRSADTSGVFHFKFYSNSGVVDNLFQGANSSVTNEFLNVSKLSTGEINFTLRVGGTFLSLISTPTVTANSINTISVYSTGTNAYMIFNGTKITTFGTNSLGAFWIKRLYDIGGSLSNVSFGARYISTPFYIKQDVKLGCYEPYTSEANALTNHNLIRNTNF